MTELNNINNKQMLKYELLRFNSRILNSNFEIQLT